MGALAPWWSPGTCFSEERVSGCDATCESESVSHSVVSDSATPPAPLSMGFSRQEYWSGSPFPPPGDLPHPGTESKSPTSLALASGFFTAEPPGGPLDLFSLCYKNDVDLTY